MAAAPHERAAAFHSNSKRWRLRRKQIRVWDKRDETRSVNKAYEFCRAEVRRAREGSGRVGRGSGMGDRGVDLDTGVFPPTLKAVVDRGVDIAEFGACALECELEDSGA